MKIYLLYEEGEEQDIVRSANQSIGGAKSAAQDLSNAAYREYINHNPLDAIITPAIKWRKDTHSSMYYGEAYDKKTYFDARFFIREFELKD